jgi:hypothetical protein
VVDYFDTGVDDDDLAVEDAWLAEDELMTENNFMAEDDPVAEDDTVEDNLAMEEIRREKTNLTRAMRLSWPRLLSSKRSSALELPLVFIKLIWRRWI